MVALVGRWWRCMIMADDTDYPDGVEPEETGIIEPFDPAAIRIQVQQMSLDTLVKRIREEEIDLSPDFQRNEVWKPGSKSRLIESLLIRIPLPAFYVDATNEDRWVVIDGLHRLSTLRDFIISPKKGSNGFFKLADLEFLTEMNGKTFSELPRNFQRRIEETQVTVYKLESGTPTEVKFNIFKRINTGGLPLSSQEIRHALNQGSVTGLLKDMAESEEFRKAVNNRVKKMDRMVDRELVLRFFAFIQGGPEKYGENTVNFDTFLSNAINDLNQLTSHKKLEESFLRAMKIAAELFGTQAFRKQARDKKNRFPINKSLFEAWSVNLDALSDNDFKILMRKKKLLQERFIDIVGEREFNDSITLGTGSKVNVHRRFGKIKEIIQEVLNAQPTEVA
ncbi:MAG: DUF262 domain-containing protein [Magnetococcales bacterium]|nr:DUF262 domain-containing protein [Magnetococcales bacterium]